jgi:hypothetical protein
MHKVRQPRADVVADAVVVVAAVASRMDATSRRLTTMSTQQSQLQPKAALSWKPLLRPQLKRSLRLSS